MLSNKRVSETQQTSTRKKRRTQSKKDLFKTYFRIGDLVQVQGNDIYLIDGFTDTTVKLLLYARHNPLVFRFKSGIQWNVRWKVQNNVFMIKDRHQHYYTLTKYERTYELNQTAFYWHKNQTLYSVIIKVNDTSVTIQPIGINECIEVDKRSYTLLPTTNSIDDYSHMEAREHNEILYTSFRENDTIDGDWFVCDYDKSFDIYLLTKNSSVMDCQCKWVTAEDLLTKYVAGQKPTVYPTKHQQVGTFRLNRSDLLFKG